MAPINREAPDGQRPTSVSPPCVNYFTQPAQIRHAIVQSFFGNRPRSFQARRLEDLARHPHGGRFPCPATRRVVGRALPRPKTHPPKSSLGSTRKSTPLSPT